MTWTGQSDRSIRDALEQAAEIGSGNRTAATEAAEWLNDYLAQQGGSADSALVKKEAVKAGHNLPALQRAREVTHHQHQRRVSTPDALEAPVVSIASRFTAWGE